MMMLVPRTFRCPSCSALGMISVFGSINVTEDANLRQLVFSDGINVVSCERCGVGCRVETSLMYHDMARGFVLWFLPGADQNRLEQGNRRRRLKSRNGPRGYFAQAQGATSWERLKELIEEMEGMRRQESGRD